MSFENDKEKIRNNRRMWYAIEDLNDEYEEYEFHKIQFGAIATYEKITSKSKYGSSYGGGAIIFGSTFDFKAFLTEKIFEEKNKYVLYVKLYEKLFYKYKEYEKKVLKVFEQYRFYKSIDNCPPDNRNFLSKLFVASAEDRFNELKDYEYDLMNKKTYSPSFPVVKLTLKAKTQYDSYSRNVTYNFGEVLECYHKAEEKEGKLSFVQEQRRKVNDSLRYDILKRDKFRCCICGATANDGVKLEVDHIIPVSKGGKSEKSNLQTLCERCNRGKGIK